jgi:aminoglycoside phosphotransferase (APT) family kinase protein
MSQKLIPVRDAHRFDEAALGRYLNEPSLQVEQFAGGQSNPTFLLTTHDRRLVLRKKPPGKLLPSAHLIEREYRIIRALESSDVPVPRAHLLCEDASIIGTPFYVMEYVEGRIFSDPTLPDVTPEERGALYDEMNRTLAALHSVDWRAIGLEDFGKTEGYVRRQIERWSQQYQASKTAELEAMDRLMPWLLEHVPEKEEITIAHGDFRPGNLLFHPTEPRVLAVLDWELSTLGHPIGDLAYNCMAYHLPKSQGELSGLVGADLAGLGIPSEERYVAKYCERTGREGIPNFGFFVAFSLFRIAAICQGVYKRALDGNASDAMAGRYGKIAMQLAEVAWRAAAS